MLGTENTLRAALAQRVKRVVVLSTDKAVYPVNAMGMSKALMEKVTIAMGRNVAPNETVMCNTRYGNVMASRGSVIPLFTRQILSGQAITVTDPEMTRFMMSLAEAVRLALFAFTDGAQGDTLVEKALAATIGTLASAMSKLLNANSELRILGTRHGEKKHECLVNREEMAKAEDLGAYFRNSFDSRDLNYKPYFEQGGNQHHERDGLHVGEYTQRLGVDELVTILAELPFIKHVLATGRVPADEYNESSGAPPR